MIATMPSGGRMLINRLSRLMGERRLTITQVAAGAGLRWQTVAELYHDRSTRLDVKTLEKLCDYFDVGPEEVFEYRRGGSAPRGRRPSPARRTSAPPARVQGASPRRRRPAWTDRAPPVGPSGPGGEEPERPERPEGPRRR